MWLRALLNACEASCVQRPPDLKPACRGLQLSETSLVGGLIPGVKINPSEKGIWLEPHYLIKSIKRQILESQCNNTFVPIKFEVCYSLIYADPRVVSGSAPYDNGIKGWSKPAQEVDPPAPASFIPFPLHFLWHRREWCSSFRCCLGVFRFRSLWERGEGLPDQAIGREAGIAEPRRVAVIC